MRKLLLTLGLSIIFCGAYAQNEKYLFQDQDISAMEARSHHKIFDVSGKATLSAASTNYDVKYYRCEWEVNPGIKFIKGVVTIYFVITNPTNIISVDLMGNHSVSAITKQNSPIPFTHTNNVLQVAFLSTIQSGVKDSISIFYEGVPPSGGLGSFEVSIHGTEFPFTPVMWTLSEPFGSRDWWPCKNGLDDKADSVDIFIKHPSIYKAASNGLLKSEIPISGNKTITHWKHRYPIASYLIGFAVTNYMVLNNNINIGGDNLLMQTYCYPESQATFQEGAKVAMDAIAWYSNFFGDYPFKAEKYGHVQFDWGGGMEHQTCSFMVNMGEGLIAHELAHQWFGNKITCSSWQDIWLNEGFASFLAGTYLENKYPNNVIASRNIETEYITSQTDGSVWVDDVSNPNRIFDNRLSYAKGAHLLYMLRWILGDATFFTAVKNYINDPTLAYGFADTNHLKSHLEAASGKNLTYFFDQWYTGQGYPSYQVQWSPSGNLVEVKLSQTTSHPSVGFFQLPIPLLFRNSVTAQQKLVVLDNTSNGQLFTENLGFTADVVEFDPEVWLITKNNVLTKVSGPLPVTFSYFNAECSANSVVLNWKTSDEVNADFFEIQQSDDALTWKSVAKVPATGGTNMQNSYTYEDASQKQRQPYYRIAEHDRDGSIQLTRIVSVECDSKQKWPVIIVPNPVKEEVLLEISDNIFGPILINIYDLKGHKHQTTAQHSRSGKTPINVAKLPDGIYILKWNDDHGESGAIRFLKE
jgi:hypothetical protein